MDLKKNRNKNNQTSSTSPPANSVDPEVPLFGDPDDYQSMTMEEKEEETASMMTRHKSWSKKSFMEG